MQSLEEEVHEQLQFFQKHLATLAGNQETTDADLGEAYPTPAPFIDDAVAVGSEACQRALCRQPGKGARRIAYTPKGESAESLALMQRIDELFLIRSTEPARWARHLRLEGVRIGRRRGQSPDAPDGASGDLPGATHQ